MTNFQRVSAMNVAFGNPKGDPHNIDFDRLHRQCQNIVDELTELFVALGADAGHLKRIGQEYKNATLPALDSIDFDLDGVRDALCDIHVFAYGAHHFMGIDADKDMNAVLDGVMTRFVKDEGDLQATLAKHRAKGATLTYLEGSYPTAVLKSAEDQPDAPKGKFLKSASFKETVFPPI